MVKRLFIHLKLSIKLKQFVIILIYLIFSQYSLAQMTIAYSIGVMGDNLKITTNSNPLNLSNSNCLQISNGISKYFQNNTGTFVNDCVVNLDYTKLSIQVGPNPFINTLTVTFKTKIDNDMFFKVSIYNNTGQLVKIYNVLQNLFYNGYKMQLIDLPVGIYILQINSSKVNEIFKILKNE